MRRVYLGKEILDQYSGYFVKCRDGEVKYNVSYIVCEVSIYENNTKSVTIEELCFE